MKNKLINYLFLNQVAGETFYIYMYRGDLVHTTDINEFENNGAYKIVGRFKFWPEYSPYSKNHLQDAIELQIQVAQLAIGPQ